MKIDPYGPTDEQDPYSPTEHDPYNPIGEQDPYNPMGEQDPIDKALSDSLSSSMSSDEGIGASDYEDRESSFTVFREHTNPLFACSHLHFGELNRAHSSIDKPVGGSKKDYPDHYLNRSSRSIDRRTWGQDHRKKALLFSDMEKFYQQQKQELESEEEKDSEDENAEGRPEIGPKKRRSRRRASCVLCFAQASTGKGPWHNLLFRYQVLSLGRSNPYTSRDELRRMIIDYPHNSEAQYYKLSYEREPQ